MNYDQLVWQFVSISDVSLNLSEAADVLARNANGSRSHIMPAATAYVLLDHLKLTLVTSAKLLDPFPQCLQNFLDNHNVTVTNSRLSDR